MKMRPIRLAASLLLALLAAAPAAAQEPPSAVRVDAPPELAGFRLVETKVYESADAGTMLRYAQPWGHVDLFVYPVPPGLRPCRPGCDTVAVHEEAGRFAKDMVPLLLSRGLWQKLAVAGDARVAVGGMTGRHLRLSGTREGRPVASHFVLLSAGRFLLKMRADHPPSPENDSAVAAVLQAAARELPARVASDAPGSASCPHGASESKGVTMAVTLTEGLATVAARIPAAFAAAGLEPSADQSLPGFWVSRPLTGWPRGAEDADWHGSQSPGVLVIVSAEAAGRGTKVQVSAQALCRVTEGGAIPAAEVGATLETFTATLVAGGIVGDRGKRQRGTR